MTEVTFNPTSGTFESSEERAAARTAAGSPTASRDNFSYEIGGDGVSIQYDGKGGAKLTRESYASEFNGDYSQPGDILSTLRTPTGLPVTNRHAQPDDLIRYQGMDIPVKVAADLGLFTLSETGRYLPTQEANAGAGTPQDAEEQAPAAGGEFRADDTTESLLTELTQVTGSGTQIAAVNDFAATGEVSKETLARLAGEAGVEPEVIAEHVAKVHQGMFNAVMDRMGIHDEEAFAEWVDGDDRRQGELTQAIKELLTQNDTSRFDALGEAFAATLDRTATDDVIAALQKAGIEWERASYGDALVLTIPGHGTMSFEQAVKAGLIKVSRV